MPLPSLPKPKPKPKKPKAAKPLAPRLSRTRRPPELEPSDWQTALRRQFGREQNFGLQNLGSEPFFSDFSVSNPDSETRYRVSIRSQALGRNFCTCLDYATKDPGTCKHIKFTRAKLLQAKRYPYQAQGALFAASVGRCLIGDEMGLGKTIQAIVAAEFFARHFGVSRVLVVRPTSLKHQRKNEFARCAGRQVQVIHGLRAKRQSQYAEDGFCKVTHDETLERDADLIVQWAPDLVTADEAQRIKNGNTSAACTAPCRICAWFATALFCSTMRPTMASKSTSS